jgi:DNA polymerase III alpha subunit
MILGYIDGSGNRENRTIKTTNKDLATGLLIGLHRMKIKSYMTEDEPGVYRVSWSFDFTSTKIDSGFDTTQQWAKVIKVEKENDNQKVWDLSIEEVHSFIVGGLVVHNCFQEQTTLVAREIGKMKPTDAEELRRIFSKKQKAKALAMKPLFMEGAVKTVGQEKAEMIWSQMETSSRYSFNLSHASAYAMITYACMYLRYHYPMEWWASVLTNADESEISTTLFKHVRDKVVPPDINTPSNEMEIDYDQNKIRAKMTVLKGLGEAVAEPIVKGAPYSDIKDFVRKKVAGPSLTRRLIHVGVMDSLFPKGASLLEKMQIYEDAVLEVAYEEKIASGKKAKAPGRGKVDPQYLSMGPLQDFKAKKMILPTLPMNLSELVVKFSPIMNEGTLERPMFADDKGRAQPMLTGDQFHEVEKRAPFERPMYFCVPAYIVDMKEFNFNKNEKKALKMTVDIDGRISERVMWPAWGENVVVYPKELKKHSIVLLFMTIKEGRTEVKIYGIKILS